MSQRLKLFWLRMVSIYLVNIWLWQSLSVKYSLSQIKCQLGRPISKYRSQPTEQCVTVICRLTCYHIVASEWSHEPCNRQFDVLQSCNDALIPQIRTAWTNHTSQNTSLMAWNRLWVWIYHGGTPRFVRLTKLAPHYAINILVNF